MTKRKPISRRKAVKAAKQAVSRFVPSPDIIRRSVTVEEAVKALEKRGALWAHRAVRT